MILSFTGPVNPVVTGSLIELSFKYLDLKPYRQNAEQSVILKPGWLVLAFLPGLSIDDFY